MKSGRQAAPHGAGSSGLSSLVWHMPVRLVLTGLSFLLTTAPTTEALILGKKASKALIDPETIKREGVSVGNQFKKIHANAAAKAQEHMVPAAFTADDGSSNYLIASFPRLKMVQYVHMPDLVWRPLVISGLVNPTHIVVDEDRSRLYIVDGATANIKWYILQRLSDGKTLVSGGRQKVAVIGNVARSLAIDLDGNLWFAGTSTPLPPVTPVDAIWKQSLLNIDTASGGTPPLEPLAVWSKGHTQSTPSNLALDSFNIFYGNDAGGKTKGSVVKAAQQAPIADPGGSLQPLADNADTVYSVAVTPTSLFYGTDKAVYGILKGKVGASCGTDSTQCPVITDQVEKPTAMVWDGDGSIVVADAGKGVVSSFASGSISPHALDKIIDAGEVFGLALFTVPAAADAESGVRGSPFLLSNPFIWTAFLLAVLGGCPYEG